MKLEFDFNSFKRNKWTLEACQKDARKYTSRNEWATKSKGSYDAARKNNWFKVCCGHMISTKELLSKLQTKWTLEKCQKEARKYNSRSEWKTKSQGSYQSAWKNGWLEICCGHMISTKELLSKLQTKWTLEACKKEARKYTSRSEWATKSKGSYEAARKNNWIKVCCGHMISTKELLSKLQTKWTLEACQKEARKYTSRNEWKTKSKGSYNSAWKNGWLKICCGHMLSTKH